MKKFAVPKSAITEKGLKKLIKEASKKHSSMAEWATANGVTPQAVSAFFRKTQGPGIKLPEILGYRPQIVYLPLDADLIQELTAPRRIAQKPTKKVDHTKDPIEKKGMSKVDERQKIKDKLKKRKK